MISYKMIFHYIFWILCLVIKVGGGRKVFGADDLSRSGFLDASTFLSQAEMWLQPESYKKFYRFYQRQITENDRYGCHCQLKDLVSRDYIDYQDGEDHHKYFGVPIDPLDRSCHHHRECLRCARIELGCANDGISEHYLDYKLNKIGYCADVRGSCNRAYCECALQFLVDIHDGPIYGYNETFSRSASNFQANGRTCTRKNAKDQNSLLRRDKKRNIQCCSKSTKTFESYPPSGPWRLFNADRHQCCLDGEVRLQC
jgi:hypothetical protein